jgi:hypothetical protein
LKRKTLIAEKITEKKCKEFHNVIVLGIRHWVFRKLAMLPDLGLNALGIHPDLKTTVTPRIVKTLKISFLFPLVNQCYHFCRFVIGALKHFVQITSNESSNRVFGFTNIQLNLMSMKKIFSFVAW